jgi:hypothetical protein
MKITLEVTESEAIYLRDALIDKSIALRTDRNGRIIKEEVFLNDQSVSERRKQNYFTLKDMVQIVTAQARLR